MKVKLLFAGLLSASLLFSACEKEGPVGPAGPAGPTGATGATGAQGPAGNTNVSSATVTISNWIYDSNADMYRGSIIDNGITQEIMDKGVVMVYGLSNGSLVALPITLYPSSSYSRTLNYSYALNQVNITIQDSDLTQPTYPGTTQFKVVKIAGPARIGMPSNINLENYNQVAQYFNL